MKYIKKIVISHNICRYPVHYAWQVGLPLQWVIGVMRGQLRHKGNYFLDLSNHCRINPPNIFHPSVKNDVRHVFFSGLGDSDRHFMIICFILK